MSLEKVRRPLTNLSPYLKTAKNISDEEEKKILEIIETVKKKVRSWDNYEEERLRRFLELQDPDFRAKLLDCMKEHIQEINLLSSFFIRYRYKHIPKRSKTQDQHRSKREESRQKLNEAKKKTQNYTRIEESAPKTNVVEDTKEKQPKDSSKNEESKQTVDEQEKEDKNVHTSGGELQEKEAQEMKKEDHDEKQHDQSHKIKKTVKIVSDKQDAQPKKRTRK